MLRKLTFIFVLLTLTVSLALLTFCAKEEALISRKLLFDNPDKAALRVSPNHQMISYLAPVNGVLNVYVAPIENITAAAPVTNDTLRGVRTYFWAFNNEQIIYLQDSGGDENWQVHAVNVKTKEDKNLTPIEEIPGPDGNPITLPNGKKLRPRAQIQDISYKFPNEILIGLNNRNPQYHDLYRVNIQTGEMALLQQNDQFMGFQTDDDFKMRFAMQMTPDGGSEILIPDKKGWKSFEKIPMEDMLTTQPITFDKTGQLLYMIDSRGRNTAALTSVNLGTGEKTLIFENPKADLSDIMVHPTEKTIEAAASNYLRTEWKILDESIKVDIDYLQSVARGDVEITSRSLDNQIWTVAYLKDDGPIAYYLYDRSKKKADFLFTNRKNLENVNLSTMHPVIINSRDGMELISYLTLPYWTDPDGDARPDKALPMVLFVHGGPWARDSWGYDSYHQWLSNRGYAVLAVNYRGSTGFGKNFINASNLEWAAKMHDDLIDAVNWTIENGIADKNKIAIMGGSYGGYATLVGLTFTPDVFACGVDIVGPSNLRTLLETIPPYWAPMLNMFTTRVGDHRTEEGRVFLESRSPLTFVDKIKKPLLIGQGANDPRVKQSEADQIVKAMQEKNIPVTYVLYSDEGHGFARPENNLSFNAVTDIFLAEYLGGRFEPVGDDFKGSSIQIPTGAEFIPTLKDALNK
ncbi:MAG: S9 family peptidase [Calditrichaceae bacterium]|nr:S9 family peptidase [Calditrichaceae bacterium]MBN2710737.1 S9 family peptidase [Calditrichaceae bacterium]RQV95690.1 MAG: S9 family peptidase [Calditrichota bacterium]